MAEEVEIVTPKMNYIESLSSRLAHRLNQDRNGDHIDYLKMKLGLETILFNLTKSVVVYGVAIILGLIVETLILHLAYIALRRYSYGLHASSSAVCTWLSILLFVGFPYLSTYIQLGIALTVCIGVLYTVVLYFFAPADTDKSPVIGKERRKMLRNKSMIVCSIVTVIAILIPDQSITSLLMLGMTIQIVMILPLTYKLLRRSVNNYEQYETGN